MPVYLRDTIMTQNKH